MNERIRELAAQAKLNGIEFDGVRYYVGNEETFIQFAELIVQECAGYIFVLDAEPVSHKSAARMLMDHFGVKK